MKSIPQIAKETDLNRGLIRHYIIGNNFPCEKHNNQIWIDSETENKLHHLLHMIGKLEYLTLESKLNKTK